MKRRLGWCRGGLEGGDYTVFTKGQKENEAEEAREANADKRVMVRCEFAAAAGRGNGRRDAAMTKLGQR
jgi:hypothetical protein